VEPQLGIAKQIKRHEYHLLIVRRQVHMEEPFAVIQPWHGVAGAVELRKFHLVGSGVGVVAGIPCIIIPVDEGRPVYFVPSQPGGRCPTVLTYGDLGRSPQLPAP
jgi:hypothetical protein